jgi:hypothetical protein
MNLVGANRMGPRRLNMKLGQFRNIQLQINKEETMGTSIEYQNLMTEIVYINLPGPTEPNPGMTGGELLHGFLAELYHASNPEVKIFVTSLCLKWNVHYR